MFRMMSALGIGAIFGIGLAISGMLNPEKVRGFLDITRLWDPSLMFVMVGGIAVTLIGFPLVLRRPKPVLAELFQLPSLTKIDRPLLVGAALFGIGWGLGGLCPGPALAALSIAFDQVALFVVMMLAGLWIGGKIKL